MFRVDKVFLNCEKKSSAYLIREIHPLSDTYLRWRDLSSLARDKLKFLASHYGMSLDSLLYSDSTIMINNKAIADRLVKILNGA